MFENLKTIFKSKNARSKLLITFVLLLVVRFLVNFPAPGINRDMLSVWANSKEMKAFGFMDVFSGNTMESISIGAIGVTAYINASIIIQLLTVAIPYLNNLTKQGKEGTDKIKKITFFFSLGIAIMQASFFALRFHNYGMLSNGWKSGVLVVLALVIGAMLIYGIANLIDKKGIGNGVSFVIGVNIASGLYQTFGTIYQMFIQGQPIAKGVFSAILTILFIGISMYFIIYYSNGEKRIGVTYPGSNRYTNASKTYLPIKPSMCGVMPAIMTVSFFSLIAALPMIFNMGDIPTKILRVFDTSSWFSFNGWDILYNVGVVLYVAMIIFCTYVYSNISFNPQQVADNLRLNGGIINGIRQDKMAKEIERQMENSLLLGGIGMAIIMLVPIIISKAINVTALSIGGTSLIILVSVATELSKKIMADAKIESDSKISFRGKGRKLNVKTYQK